MRTNSAVWHPEAFCPICGDTVNQKFERKKTPKTLEDKKEGDAEKIDLEKLIRDGISWRTHRCAERTLRGIDSAHKRDADELHPYSIELPKALRVAEGFQILQSNDITFEHRFLPEQD